MADRVVNPSQLSWAEYQTLDDDAQYQLWVSEQVPGHWYIGQDTTNIVPITVKKREPTIWRPVQASYPRPTYNYVPYDSCERSLERVEDAIREVNPELAKTPRLIQSEVTK